MSDSIPSVTKRRGTISEGSGFKESDTTPSEPVPSAIHELQQQQVGRRKEEDMFSEGSQTEPLPPLGSPVTSDQASATEPLEVPQESFLDTITQQLETAVISNEDKENIPPRPAESTLFDTDQVDLDLPDVVIVKSPSADHTRFAPAASKVSAEKLEALKQSGQNLTEADMDEDGPDRLKLEVAGVAQAAQRLVQYIRKQAQPEQPEISTDIDSEEPIAAGTKLNTRVVPSAYEYTPLDEQDYLIVEAASSNQVTSTGKDKDAAISSGDDSSVTLEPDLPKISEQAKERPPTPEIQPVLVPDSDDVSSLSSAPSTPEEPQEQHIDRRKAIHPTEDDDAEDGNGSIADNEVSHVSESVKGETLDGTTAGVRKSALAQIYKDLSSELSDNDEYEPSSVYDSDDSMDSNAKSDIDLTVNVLRPQQTVQIPIRAYHDRSEYIKDRRTLLADKRAQEILLLDPYATTLNDTKQAVRQAFEAFKDIPDDQILLEVLWISGYGLQLWLNQGDNQPRSTTLTDANLGAVLKEIECRKRGGAEDVLRLRMVPEELKSWKGQGKYSPRGRM